MMVILNVPQCNNVTKEDLAADEILSLGWNARRFYRDLLPTGGALGASAFQAILCWLAGRF